MPLLLAVGHVTWDKLQGREVLGGSVSYATLAARKLGWDAAALTAAAPDFHPGRDLPGVPVFVRESRRTTRFENAYEKDGSRHQVLLSRADDIDLAPLPDAWRDPDVLLLGPVAAEVRGGLAASFGATLVGALAQGWLRQFDAEGRVSALDWRHPGTDLAGVHVLFLSRHDLPQAAERARELLAHVPIVVLTKGWEGLDLLTREAVHSVPSLPRTEVDPTGAGDVFAAAFLVRYHETGDLLEAAAFGACAASCVVEGLGAATVGDRDEVTKRLKLRERLIEEGEWDE